MSTRREFIATVVSGAATLAVSGGGLAPKVLGANDRVRIGLIGAGGRGQEIFKSALKCPNTEAVAVADVYTRRLDEVKKFAPQAKTYQDFRRLLDDKSIDAVLIATPQHVHALNFVPAIQAGKDVYQEKTMAFNPDHAKRMRAALRGSGRVVQVGYPIVERPRRRPRQRTAHAGADGDRDCAPHPPLPQRAVRWVEAHHPRGLQRGTGRLGGVPGRGRETRVRSQSGHQLAVSTGTTPAGTCTRTWSTRWASGARSWS